MTAQPPSTPAPRRAWGSLSREQVVAAALELARREGLGALSIRRLAAEIGASRMAIYRHVADKDALLDLVADAIAAADILPPGIHQGPWPQRLRQLAHGLRRQLLTYPGLADLLMGRHHHGPAALGLVETILATIAEAGLGPARTTRYYTVFIDIVLGRVHREIHGDPFNPQRTAEFLQETLAHPGLPHLHAAAPHLRATTPEQVLETELDLLIGALQSAATNPAPPRPAGGSTCSASSSTAGPE